MCSALLYPDVQPKQCKAGVIHLESLWRRSSTELKMCVTMQRQAAKEELVLLAVKVERDKAEKEVEKLKKEVSSLDKLDELWAKYTRSARQHPFCLGQNHHACCYSRTFPVILNF